MAINFAFVSQLATFVLVVDGLNRSSQGSPSLSVLATILASLSLIPFACSAAVVVKSFLVYGVTQPNCGLASSKLRDEDVRAFMEHVLEERCPGHLDIIQGRQASIEASLLNDLSQESSRASQPPSARFENDKTNYGDGALLPYPHGLDRPRCSRVGHTSLSNESPAKLPASKICLSTLRDPLPIPCQAVDLNLSVVGQYLARHYGMFAWRIHPLVRAHNAFASLDASFRRLDVFMHSARAGILYHELIIFADHLTVSHTSPSDGQPQATWRVYAARTRVCDLLDPRHTCFLPIDAGECDGAQEWQNCLQWDAPIARVLNTAYMRRLREAVIQRWDEDAREYWRRSEGLSDARVDRVSKAILAYGVEFPLEEFSTEPAFEGAVSSSPKVHQGTQNSPEATHEGKPEDEFFQDESGCAVGLSPCDPDCGCQQDEDATTNGSLCKVDFEKELGRDDQDVEHGFKFEGVVGPEFDFGSLDSILSGATPPPASVTPSSSDISSSDMDLEFILYPRLVRSSTPISCRRDSRFLKLRSLSRTRIHPTPVEESLSFATSSSSERILADFSAASLALSTKTSTGMDIRDSESPSSSSPRVPPLYISQPVEGQPHDPSLLDLALALGTHDSEERLRKRELTSSSSYPSPPPSPSPQLSKDRYPQVPEGNVAKVAICAANGRGQHEEQGTSLSHSRYKYSPPTSSSSLSAFATCDANGTVTNATRAPSIPASECDSSANPVSEIARDSLCTQMDSDALPPSATQSLPSSRKLRLTLNVTFSNPPSCNPSASIVPVEPSAPRVRTAFSLWEAIMRPEAPPLAQPSVRRQAGVGVPTHSDRSPACGQTRSLEESLGVHTPTAGADELLLDTSDSEWEIVRIGKKTRRGGEKARRQRERRRARIETAEAWDAEWNSLAGMIPLN